MFCLMKTHVTLKRAASQKITFLTAALSQTPFSLVDLYTCSYLWLEYMFDLFYFCLEVSDRSKTLADASDLNATFHTQMPRLIGAKPE